MDLANRFTRVLTADTGDDPGDPALLPVRLARAAAAVLAVDGLGLSVHGDGELRTPLASSSDTAALAERLQFTAGSGPCLTAARVGLPVFGTEDLLARRWPAFHDLLRTKTPYSSVLTLALPGYLRGLGALDCYFTDPTGPVVIDVDDARCVAGLLSTHLGGAADWSVWTATEGPGWLRSPAARERGRLWMAVGMVVLALRLSAEDALELLRGRAYAGDRTVDDLAADIVARRIPVDRLRTGTAGD
ncbi:ANTAR domain-containing protein [Geodermatophilus sp. SYSU D00815]